MIYIIMGVCSCGKTTISKELSKSLNIPCYDADDFHSNANIQKMKNCIPLKDCDRKPWLDSLSEKIKEWDNIGGAILACSALKESYRQILNKNKNVIFILLHGKRSLIKERMLNREDHYMPVELLISQFEILEIPDYAIKIPIDQPVEKIVSIIINKIRNKT
ncbi:MAG: gluconokinase [Candidatus Lokiarchaeota archaeon]|nr:gluconokinase [Candidatus Lokiarchaeota archaeon]